MSKLQVAGVCVLLVLVAIAGAVLCITTRFNNKYNAQIAAIRAAGYPVTPAEFDAEPIADADNAALVYEQIFKSMDEESMSKSMDLLPQSLAKGDPSQWAKVRSCLSKCEETVDLLEEASLKPRCRFQRDWNAGRDFSNLRHFRQLAQLLYARVVTYAHDGDVDEAVRSADLGYKLCRSLDEESNTIGFLVQSAVAAITSKAMRTALQEADITEEQARRLYDTVSRMDTRESMKQALVGERVYFLTTVDQLGGAGAVAMPGGGMSSGTPSPVETALNTTIGTIYGALAFRGDVAVYLERMAEDIESLDLPYKEMKADGLIDGEVDVPFYAMLTKVLIPVRERMDHDRFRRECTLNGDLIILALAAYKDRYREYPQSLAQLRSNLGWEIPKDPYGGGDFGYKRKGDGYILWSTGPDAENDGGVQNSGKAMDQEETGDWVWEMK